MFGAYLRPGLVQSWMDGHGACGMSCGESEKVIIRPKRCLISELEPHLSQGGSPVPR